MARKQKRIVFRVTYNSSAHVNRWIVREGKKIIARWQTKADAVWFARVKARKVHAYGWFSQLVIHGVNGRIQTEHTYGADPRRTKG